MSRRPGRRTTAGGPLLVFGPRSTTYDFGPGHPLTPRRFGPGIDLLRELGAEPGLAPAPADDADLLRCHTAAYVAAVRRFSADPFRLPEAGIGPGDDPPFAGMHEAASAVAGGSMQAMAAILRGDVEHAFHPGGGLHHAMADRASGFCIYDDPALAIAVARAAGLRVLYLDFDVHHGDGVQALHRGDPGVLTFSIHETGRSLFPGTGDVDELGEGSAAGTSANLPLDAGTGEAGWLAAIRRVVPELAAAFGPDVIVSQHGADSHAWDPLAHLRNSVTAMGAAARLADELAHRHAGGRWLATGGGGYDAYRVVPRAWAQVWLAGAHREAPRETPLAWRQRWAAEAERYGQAPLPERFDDEPNVGLPADATPGPDRRASEMADLVRELTVPALLRAAVDLGWWTPRRSSTSDTTRVDPVGRPAIVRPDRATWDRLVLAPGVIAPADPSAGHALVAGALASGDGVAVTAAVAGTTVVGLCLSAAPGSLAGTRAVLVLGVTPGHRGQGLATALLREHLSERRPGDAPVDVVVTVAERDPYEPLPRTLRGHIARRLLEAAGFQVQRAGGAVGAADPPAIVARLG